MSDNVFLLLGSNIGNRLDNLTKAKEFISKSGIRIRMQSGVYKSPPWGKTDQDSFLNQAIEVETKLSPMELLKEIKVIEKLVGRKKRERWGPREIDIDILIFRDVVLNSEILKIPHPELSNRSFALVPLNEIASEQIVPGVNIRVKTLLQKREDKSEISLYS